MPTPVKEMPILRRTGRWVAALHPALTPNMEATMLKATSRLIRRINLRKLLVWLAVVVFCFLFWFGIWAAFADSHRLDTPPPEYDRPTDVLPIVVRATLDQTQEQCRRTEITWAPSD